jgi:hypothetical protein
MAGTPIVLNLYDKETSELIATHTAIFIPWKLLKMGIRLNKKIGDKPIGDLEDADIDELTNYIRAIFPEKLTLEDLDEHADINEMMTVMQSVISKAKGIMDPTLPPAAKQKK